MTIHDAYPDTEKPPVEIERKFLVGTPPENFEDHEHTRISQGYLVIGADGSEARIRDNGGKYTMTVKSKGDLSRGEWETTIDEGQFNTLWPATEGKRVEKTRYGIPYNGAMIELDIYEGPLSGLMSAEVEFPDETTAQSFKSPDWFAVEVTSDKTFKNQQLAVNGLPG